LRDKGTWVKTKLCQRWTTSWSEKTGGGDQVGEKKELRTECDEAMDRAGVSKNRGCSRGNLKVG